jgi:hypothetical protein
MVYKDTFLVIGNIALHFSKMICGPAIYGSYGSISLSALFTSQFHKFRLELEHG